MIQYVHIHKTNHKTYIYILYIYIYTLYTDKGVQQSSAQERDALLERLKLSLHLRPKPQERLVRKRQRELEEARFWWGIPVARSPS